jgi:hypothetical protein
MTVKQFYADRDRSESAEIAFGLEWTLDADPHVIYGLHWIESTKEVYVLRGPQAPIDPSPPYFGNTAGGVFVDQDAYEVIVLGTADSGQTLAEVLHGWEHQMSRPNSLQWVRQRLYEAAGQRVS